MSRRSTLREIQALEPVRDHQRIVFLSARVEFPFDTTRALELALFRTFCVPSIAETLVKGGEFLRRPQKRYDDTDIIISEMMEWGYDSPRGAAALRRMNVIHDRFIIDNDDFRYVLSTFIFEPIRWNQRFGWRPLCEQERLAYFYFWRAVGVRMHISDLPGDYETFEVFNRDYERSRFRPNEATRSVGTATVTLFAHWFPAFVRPLVGRVIMAMLDEPVRQACGFPAPSRALALLVAMAMRCRAWLLRLWPARRPRLRTLGRHATYPHGYDIEGVGPDYHS